MSLIPEACYGHLSVLNCGAGDLEFKFDNDDPQETVRAKRVIEDMLKRGYAIFVQIGKKLAPVKGFDPKKECYIIADGPLYAGDQGDPLAPQDPVVRGKGKKTREIPMKKTKATAVAPTAGG